MTSKNVSQTSKSGSKPATPNSSAVIKSKPSESTGLTEEQLGSLQQRNQPLNEGGNRGANATSQSAQKPMMQVWEADGKDRLQYWMSHGGAKK